MYVTAGMWFVVFKCNCIVSVFPILFLDRSLSFLKFFFDFNLFEICGLNCGNE